jgi:hypothetical protein
MTRNIMRAKKLLHASRKRLFLGFPNPKPANKKGPRIRNLTCHEKLKINLM